MTDGNRQTLFTVQARSVKLRIHGYVMFRFVTQAFPDPPLSRVALSLFT